MKITAIDAVRLDLPSHELKTTPRRDSWAATAEVANPMSRYPHVKAHRGLWLPQWGDTWCRVTLEDGTQTDVQLDHSFNVVGDETDSGEEDEAGEG